jgi:glycosyltransferase involved in cell wall biosynthesis
MNERRIVALLGRRDEPTDAIEEYCRYLGGALRDRGFAMELVRVAWKEDGWSAALQELRQSAAAWSGRWVLLQYTALSWSERGFPSRFLRVVKELRASGARLAVVYHDVEAYGGRRPIDIVRRRTQLHVMRKAFKEADLAVFTIPLAVVSWLHPSPTKTIFIPVGANLPVMSNDGPLSTARNDRLLRVAVFGITEGQTGRKECRQIADAMRFAAKQCSGLELHAFGRGAIEAEACLREALKDAPVRVLVEGVLAAEQVVRALSAANVALFVRAAISSRRGSAIAGIACGLPVIAYHGPDTAPPITDAGVVLVSREKQSELGEALLRVLSDFDFRSSLAERSRQAQHNHFGWDAIAERYVAILNK